MKKIFATLIMTGSLSIVQAQINGGINTNTTSAPVNPGTPPANNNNGTDNAPGSYLNNTTTPGIPPVNSTNSINNNINNVPGSFQNNTTTNPSGITPSNNGFGTDRNNSIGIPRDTLNFNRNSTPKREL